MIFFFQFELSSGRGHLYYPIEFKNGQYVPPEIKPYNTDVEDYYIIAMLMVGMQYEHYCTTCKCDSFSIGRILHKQL